MHASTNLDAKPIETKKTFISNEESDEEENEVVEKYSKILMNHSKDENDLAFDENLLMDTVRPRAKAETEGQMSENNKTTEKKVENIDIAKKKSETDEKNENLIKLRSQNEKNAKIDKTDSNNSTNQETNVPKRYSSRKERNEAALKEKQEIKNVVRNKFYNIANNSKVWKTFFGNFSITNKNEIASKDDARKIIDEHDFDYLNFYETEVQTFGGNM